MDGWMDGWVGGWWVGGWMDGWVDGWVDGRTDGRRVRQTDNSTGRSNIPVFIEVRLILILSAMYGNMRFITSTFTLVMVVWELYLILFKKASVLCKIHQLVLNFILRVWEFGVKVRLSTIKTFKIYCSK